MRQNLLISVAIAITVAVSLLSVFALSSDASSATPVGSDTAAVEAGDNGVVTNSAFAPQSNRSFGRSGNGARR